MIISIFSNSFQCPYPAYIEVHGRTVMIPASYPKGLEFKFPYGNLTFRHAFRVQNYWSFGPCPLSGILETRKHNVSENGSVSVLR
jgi:hypothetical protein